MMGHPDERPAGEPSDEEWVDPVPEMAQASDAEATAELEFDDADLLMEAHDDRAAAAGSSDTPRDEPAGDDEEPAREPERLRDPRDARIEVLERELAARDQTLHDYIKAHKKAQGEFDAFRQRLQRDQERELEAASGRLVEGLLDVLDNLERSLESAQRGGSADALRQGVELVTRQFIQKLEDLGVTRHDPTGEAFDPNTMEAMGLVPVKDPALDNRVVATIKTGYRLGDREVRPALVQVGRKV